VTKSGHGEGLAILARADDGVWQEMAGSNSKLSRKQEQAIVALLTHRSVEEAARATGIGVRTLHRWMKDPEFDAAYRAAKQAAYGQSIARVQYLSSAAVLTLGKVMLDPATPPATKVRAADSILAHASKAVELDEDGGRPIINVVLSEREQRLL
jgi:transposase ISL3 family protein